MSSSKDLYSILIESLPGLDEDTTEYFSSILVDGSCLNDETTIKESLVPFLESYGFAADEFSANELCSQLISKIKSSGINHGSKSSSNPDEVQLLNKVMSLSSVSNSAFSETEKAALDTLWGFDQIRNKRNETMESTEDAGSSRYERKAAKEQKKWLSELDKLDELTPEEIEENQQISNMTLPDFSGNNNEKDILVNNITINFGGKLLLDGADLRLVYGRRYGLIGKNGVGKTTLLRHMASFDIEGFPRHHRILHVKQEVKSSSKSVVEVVLESDVERSQLLARQKMYTEQQLQTDDAELIQNLSRELLDIHERLSFISADTAEARASVILAGLRFTDEMQHASTAALSGGWLMRVALASALFIEPDILMLDEPTNHLDLEAVLWLQNYLLNYPHTILLVSHDRAFLNEVCTDIILFKDLKLQYYRGDFDTYEKTRAELELLQRRQHEAQKEKLAHMQEFVDKFRYNAKRASLVQSRIKAINKAKEDLCEDVVEEASFTFFFPDAGALGRNVIKLQQASFGFPAFPKPACSSAASQSNDGTQQSLEGNPVKMLFEDVDLSIEQTSRIALVGPNGAGKSTLLNLIQSKLKPTSGTVIVNPQLRLAIFTQHHLDSFDLTLSPLQNMMNRWPLSHESDLRAHLGRYEINGNDALKPMKFSSGGQKSRVAFACLTFTKPHVVLLDEPTNHLDMGAIAALIGALSTFNGGMLVISHDQHFIQSVCNEIWVVGDGRVKQFNGSFEDYKKIALEHTTKTANNQVLKKK